MKSVFISSTFKDMQAERDLLHERIFPRLRKIIGEYGEDIQELDLRWGVDTIEMSEEESGHQVLRVCIDAIDRCRPYIIVLLGERYGWIPEPKLVESLRDERVAAWYEKQMSITNLEIKYGALSEEETLKNCVFCFRDPKLISKMDEEHRPVYDSESPMHRERLNALKQQIRAKTDAVILDYEAEWDAGTGEVCGLERFGEDLYGKLVQMIQRDFQGLEAKDPEEQLFLEMERIKEQYLSSYIVRYREEAKILYHILWHDKMKGETDGSLLRRVILKGEAGSGKSALMASAEHTIKEAGYTTILYFSGNSGCQSLNTLKDYVIYRLEEICGEPHETGASRDDRLRFLSEKSEDKKIYCFIDAVDQLFENEKGGRLDLLDLCPNLYYVLSSLSDFPIEDLVKTYIWPFTICRIGDFAAAERKQMIGRTASKRGKKLDAMITEMTVREPGAGNPLYLSMLLQRYFMMDQKEFEAAEALSPGMEGLHQYMERLLLEMPDQVEPMAEYLFQVTGRRFGLAWFQEILRLLALSRYGLSEKELEGILSVGGMRFLQVEFQQLVSYLYDAFSLREDGKWTFAHRLFQEAVLHGMTEEDRKAVSGLLIQYSLHNSDYLEREGYYYLLKEKHPAGVQVLEQAGQWKTKQEVLDLVGEMAVYDNDSRAYFLELTRELHSDALCEFWLSFELDNYDREFCCFLEEIWKEMLQKEKISDKWKCRYALKLSDYESTIRRKREESFLYLRQAEQLCQGMAEPEKSRTLSEIYVKRAIRRMNFSAGTEWEAAKSEFESAVELLKPFVSMGDGKERREAIYQDVRNKENYAQFHGDFRDGYLEELLEDCLIELTLYTEEDEAFDRMKVDLHSMLTRAYQVKGHFDGEKSLAHGKKALELSKNLIQKAPSIRNMELRLYAIENYAYCYKKGYRYPYLEEYLLLTRKIFGSYPVEYWKDRLAYACCSFALAVDDAVESRSEIFPEELWSKAQKCWEEGFGLYEELLAAERIRGVRYRYELFLVQKAEIDQKRGYRKRALQYAKRGRELVKGADEFSNKERELRDLDLVIAKAYCEICKPKEALPYAKESVEMAVKRQEMMGKAYTQTAEAWLVYAQTLYYLRKDTEALEACEETHKCYESLPNVQAGRTGQASAAELHYIQSRILLEQGKLSEAEAYRKIFGKYCEDKRDSWEYGRYLLLDADFLLCEGKEEQAKERLDEAYQFWHRRRNLEDKWFRRREYTVKMENGRICRYICRSEMGYYRKAAYYRLYSFYKLRQLLGDWDSMLQKGLENVRIRGEKGVRFEEWSWHAAKLPAFERLLNMVPGEVREQWMFRQWKENEKIGVEEQAARIASCAGQDPDDCVRMVHEIYDLYQQIWDSYADYENLNARHSPLGRMFQLEPEELGENPFLSEEQKYLFEDESFRGIRVWYPVLELCAAAYQSREKMDEQTLERLCRISRFCFEKSGWKQSEIQKVKHTKTWNVAPLSREALEMMLEILDDEKKHASLEGVYWRDVKNTCAWELYQRTGEAVYVRRRLDELSKLYSCLCDGTYGISRETDKERLARGIEEFLVIVLKQGGDGWAGELLGYLQENCDLMRVLGFNQLSELWMAFEASIKKQTHGQEALREDAEEFWQAAYQVKWEREIAKLKK